MPNTAEEMVEVRVTSQEVGFCKMPKSVVEAGTEAMGDYFDEEIGGWEGIKMTLDGTWFEDASKPQDDGEQGN